MLAISDKTGTVNGTTFYEPFGATTQTGEAVPFQFTGRVPVSEGLYYYRARFYDPHAGRFLSEDPIGFAGGDVNLYRYVGNDPVNFVDPSGLYLIYIANFLIKLVPDVILNEVVRLFTGGISRDVIAKECARTSSSAKVVNEAEQVQFRKGHLPLKKGSKDYEELNKIRCRLLKDEE